MRSMIKRHYDLLDRATAFLLGLGVGGWLLSEQLVVAAWALTLVAALARMALAFAPRTEQSA